MLDKLPASTEAEVSFMSETNKWKSRLLSSSIPMEYEVANILVSHGFAVDTDFSYARSDAGIQKDFSVDLLATHYLLTSADDIAAEVELLVECKHRHKNNKWLFFQDVNEPDMSPFKLGDTIRAVDSYSWRFLPSGCTVAFDQDATFCLKGVEVDVATGSVHDSEIKHGLMQLQYALPRLLAERIKFNIQQFKEENTPFFFCPILLTTSTILVADQTTSIKKVEASNSIEDFASPTPWVVVHSDLTPDFERHQKMECFSLTSLIEDAWVKDLDEARLQGGEYEFCLPSKRFSALAGLTDARLFEYFSQAVVCSLDHFPSLLDQIKEITNSAASSYIATKPPRPV
jgi:hypothetical protein